jgi:cell division protease FtsH
MVCEYGMSERMGPITYKKPEGEIFMGRDLANSQSYSDQTAQAIDEEVKKIIADCQTRVQKILTDNRAKLEALAKALVEKEVLDGEEINRLVMGEAASPAPESQPGRRPEEGGAHGTVIAPHPSPA